MRKHSKVTTRVSLAGLWRATVNSTPHRRNILACSYHTGSVLFIDRAVHRIGIVNISQKCNEVKVEQWIKKILKDAPDREGSSSKKAKEGK